MAQTTSTPGGRGAAYNSIIEVLAYFAANRNFGYVDVLANALDPLTAKETLINAVRDFMSACDPLRSREAREREEVPCPSGVRLEYLERDLQALLEAIEEGGDRFFQLTRSLALRALARAAGLRRAQQGSGQSQNKGDTG